MLWWFFLSGGSGATPAQSAGTATGESTANADQGFIGTATGDSTAAANQGWGGSALGDSTAEAEGGNKGTAAGEATATGIAGFRGRAIGDSTATGVGSRAVPGTALGDSTATGASGHYGYAEGESTATADTQPIKNATGTALGDSTASAGSRPIKNADGTALGDSDAEAYGGNSGNAEGDSDADAESSAIKNAAGSAPGDSSATGIGQSIKQIIGTALGDSTASAVAIFPVSGDGTATGDSTADADQGFTGTATGDSDATGSTNPGIIATATWNVEIHQVGDDRDTSWRVTESVGDDQETTWNCIIVRNVERDTTWSIIDPATKQASTTWNVASVLPASEKIKLWYMADQGVTVGTLDDVTSWADNSNSGKDATQTSTFARPTLVANQLNGLPVVRFDGATDFLNILDSEFLLFNGIFPRWTVIAVLSDNRVDSIPRDFISNVATGSINLAFYMGTISLTGEPATAVRLTDWFGGPIDEEGETNGRGSIPNPSQHFMLTSTVTETPHVGYNPVIYLDDTVIASSTTANIQQRDLAKPLFIGRRGAFSQNYWHGDIAELIVYTDAAAPLTNDELLVAWRYLKKKWFGLYAAYSSVSTTWDVEHAPTVDQTASTTWNTYIYPRIITDTLWAVIALPPESVFITADISWNVYKLASENVDTTWNVEHLPSVAESRSTTWNSLHRPTTSETRDTSWNLTQSALSDETIARWKTRRVRKRNRSTTWKVIVFVGLDTGFTWNVHELITDDRDTTWDLRKTASLRAFPRTEERSRWNTELDGDAGTVNLQQYSEWDVHITINIDISTLWSANYPVSATAIVLFNNAGTLNDTQDTTWEVRAIVMQSRVATWYSFRFTFLVETYWNDRKKVRPGPRVTTWNVIGYNTTAANTTWNDCVPVSTTRPTSWGILLPVEPAPLDTTWYVRMRVGVGIHPFWHVRRYKILRKKLHWDIHAPPIDCHGPKKPIIKVNLSIHPRWKVVGKDRSTKTKATRWNVYRSVGGGGGTGNVTSGRFKVDTYWRILRNRILKPVVKWRVGKFTTQAIIDTTWHSILPLTKQIPATGWYVHGNAGRQRIGTWFTHNKVSKSSEATWIAFIQIEAGVSWAIRRTVAKTVDTTWTIRQVITDDRDVSWLSLHVVIFHRPIDTIWNVNIIGPSVTVTTTFNEFISVALTAGDTTWDLLELSGGDGGGVGPDGGGSNGGSEGPDGSGGQPPEPGSTPGGPGSTTIVVITPAPTPPNESGGDQETTGEPGVGGTGGVDAGSSPPSGVTTEIVTFVVTFPEPVAGVTPDIFDVVIVGAPPGSTPVIIGIIPAPGTTNGNGESTTWIVVVDIGFNPATNLPTTPEGSTGTPSGPSNATIQLEVDNLTGVTTGGQPAGDLPDISTGGSGGGQGSVTNSPVVVFVVGFSDPVTGVTPDNFGTITHGGPGIDPTIISVTPAGGGNGPSSVWIVVVDTGFIPNGTQVGTIQLTVENVNGIEDVNGNPISNNGLPFVSSIIFLMNKGITRWHISKNVSGIRTTKWFYSTVKRQVGSTWGIKHIIPAKPPQGIATLWILHPPCGAKFVDGDPCLPRKTGCPTTGLVAKITICELENDRKKKGYRSRFLK